MWAALALGGKLILEGVEYTAGGSLPVNLLWR